MLRIHSQTKRINSIFKGAASIRVSAALTYQTRSLRLKESFQNPEPKLLTASQASSDHLFSVASALLPSNDSLVVVFQQSNEYNLFVLSSRLALDHAVKNLLNHATSNTSSSPKLTRFVVTPPKYQSLQSSLAKEGLELIVLKANYDISSGHESYRLIHRVLPCTGLDVSPVAESQNDFTLVVGMTKEWYSDGNPKTTGTVGLTWYDQLDGSVFVQRCRIKDIISHVCSVSPRLVVLDQSLELMFNSENPSKPHNWSNVEFESFLSLKSYTLKFVKLEGRLEVKHSSLRVYGTNRQTWNQHTKNFNNSEKYSIECATRYLLSTCKCGFPFLQLPEKCPDDWLTLLMDPATISSIGLDKKLTPEHRLPSILEPIHHTATPMGCRALWNSASRPTRKVSDIFLRQSLVNFFRKNPDIMNILRGHLAKLGDLPVILNDIARTKPSQSNLTLIMDSLDSALDILLVCRDIPLAASPEPLILHSSLSSITKLHSLRSLLLSKLGNDLQERVPNDLSEDDTLPLLNDSMFMSCLQSFHEHQQSFKIYAHELQFTGLIRDVSFVQTNDSTPGICIKAELAPGVPAETLKAVLRSWSIEQYTPKNVLLRRPDLTESHRRSCILFNDVAKRRHAVLRTLTSEVLLSRHILFSLSKDIAHLDMLLSFAQGSLGGTWNRPGLQWKSSSLSCKGIHSTSSPDASSYDSIPLPDHGNIVVSSQGPLVRQISGDPIQAEEFLLKCAQLFLFTHMGSFVPSQSFNTAIVSRLMYHRVEQGDTSVFRALTDQRSLLLSSQRLDDCAPRPTLTGRKKAHRAIYYSDNARPFEEAGLLLNQERPMNPHL